MERFPLVVELAAVVVVGAITAIAVPVYLFAFQRESAVTCAIVAIAIIAVAIAVIVRSLGLLGKAIELSADGLTLPRSFRTAEQIPWTAITEIREDRVRPTRNYVLEKDRERVLRIHHEGGEATISELQIGFAAFDQLCAAMRARRADAYRNLELAPFGAT